MKLKTYLECLTEPHVLSTPCCSAVLEGYASFGTRILESTHRPLVGLQLLTPTLGSGLALCFLVQPSCHMLQFPLTLLCLPGCGGLKLFLHEVVPVWYFISAMRNDTSYHKLATTCIWEHLRTYSPAPGGSHMSRLDH